ncbi:hypothetical protein RRG08_014350 [Elysia crispata]|uniref:Uncharacterized protein n=1 Tax=Elysia crispata TaxID=231223 RepID=A0AAE1CJK6_9GAST|nr:hypothetical protein RRG08_014350 [Elysia crispata]
MGGERLGGIRGGDRTPNQTPGKGNSRVNRGGSRDGQTEKPGLGQVTVTVLLMETGKYATLWEQCKTHLALRLRAADQIARVLNASVKWTGTRCLEQNKEQNPDGRRPDGSPNSKERRPACLPLEDLFRVAMPVRGWDTDKDLTRS